MLGFFMAKDKLVSFQIEHLDPLGQGVSKQHEKVTFVGKTLPEEKGQAVIRKSLKGVQFAEFTFLENTSENRISPDCEHYQLCGGCQYLHTPYENELKFKQLALKKHLAKLCPNVPITLHPAQQRFNYRNRIQLHYKDNLIGFKKPFSHEILPIKNCMLANSNVQKKLKEIIQQFQVIRPVERTKSGHVEIYEFEDQVQVNWNLPYAHGGFTQVNQQMHQQFQSFLHDYAKKHEILEKTVCDIFGGDGNLGSMFSPRKHFVVDSVIHQRPKSGQEFHQFDLLKIADQQKCLGLIKDLSLIHI